MNFKEYKVTVYDNGDVHWYLEADFLKRTKPPSCSGKIVKIDGKRYKLVEA